jgi:hypothetical protein
MNFDVGNPVFLVDYLKWFHVSIKLMPLTGPVGPNLFFPTTRPPCDALGQLTWGRCLYPNIPMIEGRAGLSYQCLCVRHESPGVHLQF